MHNMEYISCGDVVMSKLRKILREKDITQVQLSEITGIRQSEISKIANDQKPNLSLRVAGRIAKAVDYTVDYIWYDWLH